MITMASLFDGIGGFPLAGQRYGIKTLLASEVELFPIAVTTIRFPDMVHVGDITRLRGEELPPVDIVCGGSPCQDISQAGRRAGLAGERSGLFFEQILIIKNVDTVRTIKYERHNCTVAGHAQVVTYGYKVVV